MSQSNQSIDIIRNIGISAHIDSGKTTLTERILYYTGRIHAIHDVRGKDGVGAKMDSMDLEREKGITIQSAATYCWWKDCQINIIDTPGHVDFTIEVERSLRVLDGAILVLCGVAGVQSQSYTVDRQMKRYSVPRLAFVNKLDRTGANPFRVVQQLREKLKLNAVAMQIPVGLEDNLRGVVDLLKMKAFIFEGDNGETITETDIPADLAELAKEKRQELIGAVADLDDAIGEKFLMEEEPSYDELVQAIRKNTIALKLVPVFMGSAFKNKAVQLLLDAVNTYLPNPKEVENIGLDQRNGEAQTVMVSDPTKPFVGYAFKLDDGRFGQLTYMRIYQGSVKKGDFIVNVSDNGKKIKIPRIVRMHSEEMEDIESAKSGDIVAFFGIDCSTGDTFTDGTVDVTMTSMFVPKPVMSLAVAPKERAMAANFSKALNKFRREDPTFQVARDEESGETIIAGMGELHLEIYIERMSREFNCQVVAGKPQVAYRETITKACNYDYTHKKQSGGSGQYAKIVGTMQPLGEDSDIDFEFVNNVVGGKIPREFIPAVEKGFKEQLTKGAFIGYPAIGVRVTLEDGQYHDVDSSEMAFRIAAMAAVREFYKDASPAALEPIMKVEVNVPEEYQGSAMGMLNQRRGIIQGSESQEGVCTVMAHVPLTEMFGFSTDLRSATQGKGEFTMEFAKYSRAPGSLQQELIKKYEEKRAAESK